MTRSPSTLRPEFRQGTDIRDIRTAFFSKAISLLVPPVNFNRIVDAGKNSDPLYTNGYPMFMDDADFREYINGFALWAHFQVRVRWLKGSTIDLPYTSGFFIVKGESSPGVGTQPIFTDFENLSQIVIPILDEAHYRMNARFDLFCPVKQTTIFSAYFPNAISMNISGCIAYLPASIYTDRFQ
jgi:hypothetical protein